MTRELKPYAECPNCGSAAVIHPDAAAGRRGYRCTRCKHQARTFGRRDGAPELADGRPRVGGRVMPIFGGLDR